MTTRFEVLRNEAFRNCVLLLEESLDGGRAFRLVVYSTTRQRLRLATLRPQDPGVFDPMGDAFLERAPGASEEEALQVLRDRGLVVPMVRRSAEERER